TTVRALDVAGMDYAFTTPGVFAEQVWWPAAWIGISSSARADFHPRYGNHLSPRISALLRSGTRWEARVSGGSGFFAPTPLTEETEAVGLARLRPPAGLRAERARMVSVDLGTHFGPVELEASGFGTVIEDPLGIRALTDSAA